MGVSPSSEIQADIPSDACNWAEIPEVASGLLLQALRILHVLRKWG